MMIAMTLSMIILAAIYDLYLQGRRNYEKPQASISVQEEMMRVVRWLKRDLLETNVQTLRSYAANGGDRPSLSLESPRTADDNESLVIGPYGVVTWQKYIYYVLQQNPSNPKLGQLIRREGPLSDQPNPLDVHRLIPVSSGMAAYVAPGLPGRSRVLATNINWPGGFYVSYEPNNPNQQFEEVNSSAEGAFGTGPLFTSTSCGRPVLVSLAMTDTSPSTGKVTTHAFQLAVLPRN